VPVIRPVVVKCRWGSVPAGWPEPPLIPDATLAEMFSRSQFKWGVAELWHDATLGGIDFAPTTILDVGPLSGVGLTQDAGGHLSVPSRTTTISAARAQATAQGFVFQPDDAVVVMVAPPPSDAGAWGRSCLLDVNGNHSFMAHEFGHVLGFNHSLGPAFGDPIAEYCDPYCVMADNVFGYKATWAAGLPPSPLPAPAGLPADWDVQMGPLPAAATVWRDNADFANAPWVRHVTLTGAPAGVTLTAYSEAGVDDTVLVVIQDGQRRWFVEYRPAMGWDRGLGLGPKLNPAANGNYDPIPPGLVVHRDEPGVPLAFIDFIPIAEPGWIGGIVTVEDLWVTTVWRSPDETRARIWLGRCSLDGRTVGSYASQTGAACVAYGQGHLLGWAQPGTGELNVANVDGTGLQVAAQDNAIGNTALASDGDALFTAWTGTNPEANLNVFVGTGANAFQQKIVRYQDSSPAGPALARLGGKLFLAYVGNDTRIYVVAGADDENSPPVAVGQETACTGPALAAASGRLYLAWPGTDGAGLLNVMSSTDGITWTDKWTLHREASFSPPALAATPDKLYLAWTGADGENHLNLGMIATATLHGTTDAGELDSRASFRSHGLGGPGLATANADRDALLAWAEANGTGDLRSAIVPTPFA
jgi:hypothetical protein